jgi:hypothetical protein
MEPAQRETMTLRDFVSVPAGTFPDAARDKKPSGSSVKIESGMSAARLPTDADKPAKELAKEPVKEPIAKPTILRATPLVTPLSLEDDSINKVPPISIRTGQSGASDYSVSPSQISSSVAEHSHPERKRSKKKEGAAPLALVLDAPALTLWTKFGLPTWARPLFYAFVFSALMLSLWAQTTIYFRDSLAYHYPETKLFLTQSCKILNCRVNPYQDINAVIIEASDLFSAPDQPQRLTLTATVRNRNDGVVAYPDLQLDFTNAQNRVVGRRYFTSKDYLVDQQVIDRGLSGNSDVVINLSMESALDDASGYRLSLVYL